MSDSSSDETVTDASTGQQPVNVLGRVVATSLGYVHGLHEHLGKLEADASPEDARDLDSARVFLEAVSWKLAEVLGRHGLPLVEGSADGGDRPRTGGAALGSGGATHSQSPHRLSRHGARRL